MEKFESDLKSLEKNANDKWNRAVEILKLCTDESEFTSWNDRDLQLTIVYEELGIMMRPGHPTSSQMLKNKIDDLRRVAFNYLRMHVNEEGENPLEKAIDTTNRYNKAMELWLKYCV